MSSKYLRLYTSVWRDDDFRRLTQADQQTYLVIACSEDMSWAGVAPLFPARYIAAKDATTAKVAKSIKALQKGRFLVVDEGTGEVMVRAFIRASGLLTQPNVIKAMCREAAKVHSDAISSVVRAEVRRGVEELLADPPNSKWNGGVPSSTWKPVGDAFGGDLLAGLPLHEESIGG